MTIRKKILLGLLILPVVMIISSIIWPEDYGPGTVTEIIFLVIGIPICLLNAWEWFMPEISDKLFGNGKLE